MKKGFRGGDENINRAGRKKGSLNKTTTEIKQVLNQVISNQLDTLEKDINKLKKTDPEAALKLSIKLIEYIIPKMNKMELSGEITTKIERIQIEIKNGTKNNNNKDLE